MIISNKHGIYKLPHEINFSCRVLFNRKTTVCLKSFCQDCSWLMIKQAAGCSWLNKQQVVLENWEIFLAN